MLKSQSRLFGRSAGCFWRVLCTAVVFVTGFASVSCGASDDAKMASDVPNAGGDDRDTGANNGTNGSDLPGEQELESTFRSPVASGKFVWIANPVSGRVAYVDAATLYVETVRAGNGPTYMAAVPDPVDDVAIVINAASGDATMLRKRLDGAITTKRSLIHERANSWSVSSSGHWAIAWSDFRVAPSLRPSDAFQDITVIDLESNASSAQLTSVALTVGYRPTSVVFNADETEAYVVNHDGISVIDLDGSGSTVSRLIPTSDDPFEASGSGDVSITDDGAYAFVRRNDDSIITILSLSGGVSTEVVLPGRCTDLDLSADGTLALAAVRETNQIAVLPIPSIVSSPGIFELVTVDNVVVGSVSLASAASVGIAYSNASDQERAVSIDFGQTPAVVRPIKLYSRVKSAMLAPNGRTGLVIHGDGSSYSLLVLDSQLPPKLASTVGQITQAAITSDGSRIVLASRNDARKEYAAYFIDALSQHITTHVLPSPPVAVGIVPEASRAYVAQEHPDGRITFFDLDTGTARTLTGFELSARVVEGSVQ